MSQVSVESLGTGDKEGYLTKCGGTIKTWKKRWFVLKGDTLFYFKTRKDTDLTGSILLEVDSECKEDTSLNVKGKKYHFTVSTAKRTFVIFSDREQTTKEWVTAVNEKIKEKKNPGGGGGGGSTTSTTTSSSTPSTTTTSTPSAAPTPSSTPRTQIALAKAKVPFLMDQESKVLEFWQIWSESLPPREELQVGTGIEFVVSTSANLEKLTWRTAGPQNIFIQKMVDFFWNVGAPESEIDRLNNVGALINPPKIGSWIDMSAKGGMDGGWYFPVEILMKTAIEAADAGECTAKVLEWAGKHNVEKCFAVGRDMGAAPPRQTEIRLKLPGDSHEVQMAAALDAYAMFGFPELNDTAVQIVKGFKPVGLCLSIITSSEGFVRLGLMAPTPPSADVAKLCQTVQADVEKLAPFETALGSQGPAFAELQVLREGFGYGVYKEGFDVVFHYHAGEEKG